MKRSYEVKTLEEAQKLAVKDFELPLNCLKLEVVRESKGFLGIGARLDVEAEVCVDGIEEGKKYIKMILETNGAEGFIEKKVRGNNVEFNIDAGDYNGYLIGKNSKNLISLQNLVSTIVNRYYFGDEKKIVLVDVGGYKKHREKYLESLAVSEAKKVVKTKVDAKLTGLNSYERKIIHNKLASWVELETHSEGEGQDRVLIISLKK